MRQNLPSTSSETILSQAVSRQGMDTEQFNQWVGLLKDRVGVALPLERKAFLETGLLHRMRETGHVEFQAYLNHVLNDAKGVYEWQVLLDYLTVHQTHFFRHQPSFDYIQNVWLQQWLKKQEKRNTLSALSVGCASGEETYSLAMALAYGMQGHALSHRYAVTGVDISQASIKTARAGVYANSKLKEIMPIFHGMIAREDADHFRIHPSIAARVAFAVVNLLQVDRAPLYRQDIIFCQNVLIYFEREERELLLERFVRLLNAGGLLVLGSGEVTQFNHPMLRRCDERQVLAFEKITEGKAA